MRRPVDAVLPDGSLILITAVNGFIGSHVADQLLGIGYYVRGVVRDVETSQWLQAHFDETYGKGKFKMVQVADLTVEGAMDECMENCSGVIHLASNVSFNPDPNVTVVESVKMAKNTMGSAKRTPSIQRFVLTSSNAAATQSRFGEVFDLTQDSWNEASVSRAWAPPPYTPDRSLDVYNASKVETEKAMWDFMKTENPHFVANSVLPDCVFGLPVDLKHQGYGPAGGIFSTLWNGGDMWRILSPGYMVDATDVALLHVGALLSPKSVGHRIFGYAHRRSWTDLISRLREMYPSKELPAPPVDEKEDLSNVVDRPKSEKILQWLRGRGWRPLEDTLKELCDSFSSQSA